MCNHPDLDGRTGQMASLEEKATDWTEDTPTGPIEVEEFASPTGTSATRAAMAR